MTGRLPLFVPGSQLPRHQVRARNFAATSDNKIHDDTVAKQYGFAGGLVPGVTIYAYMTHPVVSALGRDWLAHGTMTVRLLKPFYEGELVDVRTTVGDGGSALARLDVQAFNERQELCAVATATLPSPPPAPPAVSGFPTAPLPASAPAVSEAGLAAVDVFGSLDVVYDAQVKGARFLDEIEDPWGGYRGPGAAGHPGVLIRYANFILAENFRLNPWIHVSSEVEHFALVHHGDHISIRARRAGLFERKGHKFVELDVLMVANGVTPVMRIRHAVIYDIRRATP